MRMNDEGVDLNDLPGVRNDRQCRSHPLVLKPGQGILPNPIRVLSNGWSGHVNSDRFWYSQDAIGVRDTKEPRKRAR